MCFGHQHKLKAFSEHHGDVPSFPDALEAFSNYSEVVQDKKVHAWIKIVTHFMHVYCLVASVRYGWNFLSGR